MMQTNHDETSGRDRKRYIFSEGRFLRFLLFIAAAVFILAAVVMLLWNAILPSLIHVQPITYWQAAGLLVLCKILFGNFRPGGSGRPPYGRPAHWRQKWSAMNDEEKAKFKEEWKKRCERRGR